MRRTYILGLAACLVMISTPAYGAYVLEVDTDGADDGVLTYHPNFSFGGDTTTASQSAPSAAVGLTGGDSIFGGDGVESPDTYLYTYTPGVDGDNFTFPAGTPLNDDGDLSTGLANGPSGQYAVYTTWPFTENVSGGLTTYSLTDGMNTLFTVDIDQNGLGDEWVFLGEATLDAATMYTLSQESASNTFVSMRSSGVLFERVPEPSTAVLAAVAACLVIVAGRKGFGKRPAAGATSSDSWS